MISVLLATTGRADMVETFVASLIETTGGYDIELVAAVDADSETIDRIAGIRRPNRFRVVVDWRDRLRGPSKAWNDALAICRGDPVVLAGDDLEFQPGWLEAALEALHGFPDHWGLVGFNDGHWDGGELSTHYLMSRRFIVEVLGGVIAWECYHHSFNDVEMCERARNAARYRWAEDARVYHSHWLFGDRPQDDTDQRNLPRHGESQQVFMERRAAGFPNDFPPVIKA